MLSLCNILVTKLMNKKYEIMGRTKQIHLQAFTQKSSPAERLYCRKSWMKRILSRRNVLETKRPYTKSPSQINLFFAMCQKEEKLQDQLQNFYIFVQITLHIISQNNPSLTLLQTLNLLQLNSHKWVQKLYVLFSDLLSFLSPSTMWINWDLFSPDQWTQGKSQSSICISYQQEDQDRSCLHWQFGLSLVQTQ